MADDLTDKANEIEEKAEAKCMMLGIAVIEAQITRDGLTYGDVELKSPEEFVEMYLDLQRREVLVHLLALPGPGGIGGWYRKFTEQYQRAAAKIMGIGA
jgi:hypothetical protein